MQVTIIAAVAQNGVIGNNNSLIWHLPADLRFFKQTTTGHFIIMGRNTFESIGGGRPLPNRTTIIITRNKQYMAAEGCIIVYSLQEALDVCAAHNQESVFICGGAQIYEQAFDVANRLLLTHVHADFKGDTFFPTFSTSEWKCVAKTDFEADEKNAYAYSFAEYVK